MSRVAQKRTKAKSNQREMQFETRAVNLDIPIWMLEILDDKANSLGISRKAVINVILGQTLGGKKNSRLDLSDNLDLQGLNKLVSSEWSSKNDDEAFHDL